MATITDIHRFSAADKRFVIQNIASPGTGAVDVTTGLDYVDIAIPVAGTTPDKACVATPNTTDHTTASNGHVAVEAEANVTVLLLSIGR